MTKASKCEVCEGCGTYPIMDKFGRERYSIECPECFGSGDDGGEAEERAKEAKAAEKVAKDRENYERAMLETRAARLMEKA